MIPLYDKRRIGGGFPFFTAALIALNTIFFFCTLNDLGSYIALYGFSVSNIFDGRIYSVFTYMFLHGSIWHLVINMWFLWVFGHNLESRLGGLKFLAFYLLCGVGGAVLYALAMSNPSIPVIGASAAISGVMGGYLVLFPKNKIRTFFFLFTASVPCVVYVFAWFLIQLFSTPLMSETVAYWGHIGGFITGIATVKMFKK